MEKLILLSLKLLRYLVDSNIKIGLGTAQFGLPYGISNKKGSVDSEEVKKILQLAFKSGIKVIDTASSYGDAEKVLGQNREILSRFRLFTKTPPLKSAKRDDIRGHIREALEKSLINLGIEKVEGLFVHHGIELIGERGEELLSAMEELKTEGMVCKIGYSCYFPWEMEKLLRVFTPDIVQIPVNVFHQEFSCSNILSTLKKIGCEIHARSLFLQGLVFVQSHERDSYFDFTKTLLDRFQEDMKSRQTGLLGACLSYALRLSEIGCAIVGVCCERELREILEASQKNVKGISWELYRSQDERLINPSNWKLKNGQT